MFFIQFFLLLRTEKERTKRNKSERKFCSCSVPFFYMLNNSFVPFQTLVIIFAIRSYQKDRTEKNTNPGSHRLSSDHPEINNENYSELLQLVSSFVPKLSNYIQYRPMNAKYLSPQIQNTVIGRISTLNQSEII